MGEPRRYTLAEAERELGRRDCARGRHRPSIEFPEFASTASMWLCACNAVRYTPAVRTSENPDTETPGTSHTGPPWAPIVWLAESAWECPSCGVSAAHASDHVADSRDTARRHLEHYHPTDRTVTRVTHT
jgi:hypothetical protein